MAKIKGKAGLRRAVRKVKGGGSTPTKRTGVKMKKGKGSGIGKQVVAARAARAAAGKGPRKRLPKGSPELIKSAKAIIAGTSRD